MAITNEDLKVVLVYLLRRLVAAKVDANDLREVVRYIIDNPLPDKATIEAELVTLDETDKQNQITRLRRQLTKLEGR